MLFVNFKVLVMPSISQAQGIGYEIVRNSLIAYDQLGVIYAAAYANFDVGGYAWAKLAGAPTEPDVTRDALLARLKEPAIERKIPADGRRALEEVIKAAEDDSLMFDVANAYTSDAPPKPLGKPLLLEFSWDAIWVLSDPEQRRRAAGALS